MNSPAGWNPFGSLACSGLPRVFDGLSNGPALHPACHPAQAAAALAIPPSTRRLS